MTAIIKVPFMGQEVDCSPDGDGVWVIVKRVSENVGLLAHAQADRLRRQPWATTRIMRVLAEDGKEREMLAIHVDCLPMWLATIETSRVAEHLRPRLIAYQTECARVLKDHFFGNVHSEIARLRAEREEDKATIAEFRKLLEESKNRSLSVAQLRDNPPLARCLSNMIGSVAQHLRVSWQKAHGMFCVHFSVKSYRFAGISEYPTFHGYLLSFLQSTPPRRLPCKKERAGQLAIDGFLDGG